MMNRKSKVGKIILGVLGLTALNTTSQAQFTLDGEIRPRFEYRHGYKSVADSAQDNAAFIEQRTRLNFGYKTEGYIFKVSLQDIHIWGSQPQLINTTAKQNNNGSYLSLHEAWGEALISKNWSLKFGRQEIILDDHRIFGSVGWAAQARSHDAAIIKFKKDKLQFQLAGAYNQDNASLKGTEASKGSYKAFQYLWVHNDFGENFGASVLFLNNGKEQLDIDSNSFLAGGAPVEYEYYKDNYSQTIGSRLTYKKNKLKVASSFYSQFGLAGDRNNVLTDVNGDFDKDISAMNYGIDVSYKITKKLTGTVGYEYLSGNSQVDTNASYLRSNHAFTPLYGTNHKFNGHMDYFYVGNHFGSVGLQDIYLKLKYKTGKFWIGADVHLFSAANDVLDGFKVQEDVSAAVAAGTPVSDVNTLQTMNSSFGTEVDLSGGFNLSKGVALKAGYSVMFATETLAYLKGTTYANGNANTGQGRVDEMSSWGWLMIIIKPKFIEKKDKK
ncbi:MAG: hypothetical protein HRT73_07035 [Flavobacteriales bacterium]|nr:hypothetical protein [Flavobacteriales bacterium]